MLPTVIIMGHKIGSYTICAVLGLLVIVLYENVAVKRRTDLDSIQFVNVAVISGLGAFFGAHLLFAITNWRMLIFAVSHPDQTFISFRSFAKLFLDIFGGMVYYGGLIGGIISGAFYINHIKHIKLNFYSYADAYAPAIALFHSFGRVGCFLGGCCYGIECRWGFVYHLAPIPEANGVVRLPIQLIEAAGNLIIFFLLSTLNKKKHPNGMIFTLYLCLYPTMRFILEFFRGDPIRGFICGLSTSQWISIILILVSFVLFLNIRDQKNDESDEYKTLNLNQN